MTLDEYQDCSNRTSRFAGLVLDYPTIDLADDEAENRIVIAGLGLCGEAGEVVELLKKAFGHGHGHELDKSKLSKELGDVAWYLSEIATAAGLRLSDILDENVGKLQKRYGGSFSTEASVNRKEVDQ